MTLVWAYLCRITQSHWRTPYSGGNEIYNFGKHGPSLVTVTIYNLSDLFSEAEKKL